MVAPSLRQVPGPLVLLATSILAPGVAQACPDCPTAQVVQASVFDERFWTQLLPMMLPLFVLSVIAG